MSLMVTDFSILFFSLFITCCSSIFPSTTSLHGCNSYSYIHIYSSHHIYSSCCYCCWFMASPDATVTSASGSSKNKNQDSGDSSSSRSRSSSSSCASGAGHHQHQHQATSSSSSSSVGISGGVSLPNRRSGIRSVAVGQPVTGTMSQRTGGSMPQQQQQQSQTSQSSVCQHKEVMKDLCILCGQDIRRLNDEDRKNILQSANISMIHSIPELRISQVSFEKMRQLVTIS